MSKQLNPETGNYEVFDSLTGEMRNEGWKPLTPSPVNGSDVDDFNDVDATPTGWTCLECGNEVGRWFDRRDHKDNCPLIVDVD